MTKRIAFFDIDGTLVDHSMNKDSFIECVPDSTKEALKRLKAAGVQPVIATGRGKEAVADFAAQLGIDSLITSNGQEITYQGATLFQQFIDAATIKKLFQRFEEQNINVLYETAGGVYAVTKQQEIVAKRIGINYLDEGALPEDVLQMIIATDRSDEIQQLIPELKAVKVAPNAVNILPFKVSKASGIHQLLDTLDIPIENSLAFGDEENDLEMFDAVGTAVAMGNATAELKEKADFVTKEVWNDGIYHACTELGLFN